MQKKLKPEGLGIFPKSRRKWQKWDLILDVFGSKARGNGNEWHFPKFTAPL